MAATIGTNFLFKIASSVNKSLKPVAAQHSKLSRIPNCRSAAHEIRRGRLSADIAFCRLGSCSHNINPKHVATRRTVFGRKVLMLKLRNIDRVARMLAGIYAIYLTVMDRDVMQIDFTLWQRDNVDHLSGLYLVLHQPRCIAFIVICARLLRTTNLPDMAVVILYAVQARE